MKPDLFRNKNVLVYGAGRSGIGASSLLCLTGAEVILFDSNEKLTEDGIREKLSQECKGIRIVIGTLTDELIRWADLCVISPGIPTDIPPVIRLRQAGVPVIGEMELAYECSEGSLLAVTGTNGKTTTVTLLGELMKAFLGDERVHVVGNIGYPYTKAAPETNASSVCVAEVSSFQLETIREFHPHVAAITNITPDHLNRHHTMEEYIRVKERITENQGPEDILVLNYEDPVLRPFGEGISADGPAVWWFSSARPVRPGMYLDGDILKYSDESTDIDIIHTDDLQILGKHNYENVCAAVLCALAMGMPAAEIRTVLRAFPGVEHRIEYVAQVNGVTYYNDSKGTNPDAAIKAVEAMKRPTVLIGGGYDKDSSYDDWIESFHGKVKALVLAGATKEKIADCAQKHGFGPVYMCETFEECFSKCVQLAQPGDAVLLSPACASWGMFTDYEERGRVFKELVHGLKEN